MTVGKGRRAGPATGRPRATQRGERAAAPLHHSRPSRESPQASKGPKGAKTPKAPQAPQASKASKASTKAFKVPSRAPLDEVVPPGPLPVLAADAQVLGADGRLSPSLSGEAAGARTALPPTGDSPSGGGRAAPGDPSARLGAVQGLLSQLHLPMPAAAAGQLLAYLDLLQRWNKVYNLTALRDTGRMWTHHLADCLAVLPALRREAAGRPWRVLDVGSGGGLPGVVLAIAEPGWRVSCVDTVAKKASFIRQVAAELGLSNLEALHARVEALPVAVGGALPPFDLVTSRAFASLRDFTDWSRHALAADGRWAAMKGRDTAAEQGELAADVSVFHVEHLAVPGLDAERCLVWLRRTAPPAVADSTHNAA